MAHLRRAYPSTVAAPTASTATAAAAAAARVERGGECALERLHRLAHRGGHLRIGLGRRLLAARRECAQRRAAEGGERRRGGACGGGGGADCEACGAPRPALSPVVEDLHLVGGQRAWVGLCTWWVGRERGWAIALYTSRTLHG